MVSGLILYLLGAVPMNYSFNQIDHKYYELVNSYKERGYVDKTKMTFHLGVYRHATLVNEFETVKISIKNHNDSDSHECANYDIILTVEHYTDNQLKYTDTILKVYDISHDYYTDSLAEVYHAREIRTNRFLDYHRRKCLNVKLNCNKLKPSVYDYLHSKIFNIISVHNRTNDFKLIDLYASYNGTSRNIVAVIKHSDNKASEAFYF